MERRIITTEFTEEDQKIEEQSAATAVGGLHWPAEGEGAR